MAPSLSVAVRKDPMEYPTPSTSPITSCPASPPLKPRIQPEFSPTDSPTSALENNWPPSKPSRKRKMTPVLKSLYKGNPMATFQLDIYPLYFADPKSLLLVERPVKMSRPVRAAAATYTASSFILAESIAQNIESKTMASASANGSNSGERKLMQAPIPVDFDMTPYMETAGAPQVLWKKGMSCFDSCLFNRFTQSIYYKGGCLPVSRDAPGYDLCTEEEIRTCSTLRISPAQYLHMKQVILNAAEKRGPFKKRDAKSWFAVDVNKTAVLFDWFRALGWIPTDENWESEWRKRMAKK